MPVWPSTPPSRLLAVSAYEHATHLGHGNRKVASNVQAAPGLSERLVFHGADKLILFRNETRDRVPPFSNNPPRDHPRVYRLYNLLGPSPLTPLKEIADHDAHCFGVMMPADGRFFLVDGFDLKDGRKGRTFNAYDGQTGARLWSMPAHRTEDTDALVRLDPTGTILLLGHGFENRTTLLRLPDRQWMGELDSSGLVPGPMGKRWFAHESDSRNAKFQYLYFPEGRNGPAVPFLQDREMEAGLTFAPDGLHVAWGSADHSLVICDLVEVQRAMAEYGLGW